MPAFREFFINLNLGDRFAGVLDYARMPETWAQFGVLAGCVLFSWWAGWQIKKRVAANPKLLERIPKRFRSRQRVRPFRIVLLLVLWTATAAYQITGAPCATLKIATVLFTGFMLLILPAKLMKGKFWLRSGAVLLFVIAALYNLGVYEDVVGWLENSKVPLLPWDKNLLELVTGTLTLIVLLWLASALSKLLIHRIERLPEVPPTIRVLLSKVAYFSLYALAIVVSIQAFGISLGALAVFGGALGLGIGFGLQKVVSNLFSGLIILLDKSIKPGDVIEIGGTYGWINSLRTRYVSVITRDNKEHLIPNEDLITQPVINWSFTNRLVRLRAAVGIAYDADVRQAIDLCVEAASSFERVLNDPAPRCLLRGFGDSSIDLEIRFWIDDPSNGTANITSDVLLAVWDRFKEHKVEIPFPQRDLHIRSSSVAFPAVEPEPTD